ncbi:MAG: universal stress protein [Pyrinomonadaceae bacterium]
MKVLVAYDGSRCSEAALDDLVRAGLPESCDITVISVAENWLAPPDEDLEFSVVIYKPPSGIGARHSEKDTKMVAEATILANHARDRIQRTFPKWRVTSEATIGSPASEILGKANEFAPDLIVVGSQGRSAINRFFLGSISQKVLTEAQCSVRVARGRIEVDPTPMRILIGFDGSTGAQAAVDAVAQRTWREFSEIRLITVLEDLTPSAIGRFIPPMSSGVERVNESERERMEKVAEAAVRRFTSESVSASSNILAGNPKDILVEEAQRWNADCIFVGANNFASRMERFLLGSTSAAVAARSNCSVENVRLKV